jgi:DNA-binding response OmpR family regulator
VNSGVWRFGDAEFDEATGKLSVAGRAIELDRSSPAILAELLRHAGQDVSKDRLLRAGWPDRIVHENSLVKAVGRLRQVLAGHGAALETVYGYGYRLDLAGLSGAASAAPPPSRADALRPKGLRDPALASVAALLALAAVGGAAFWIDAQADAGIGFRSEPPVTADAPDAIGRVLWVDDHPQNNIYEERLFEEHRIVVHNATSSADALKLLSMNHYDVVISDMGRGEDRLAGVRLVEEMRASGNDTPFVIYTVRPKSVEQQDAQRNLVAEAGAQGVAVTPQEIRSVVLRLFGNPETRADG